MSTKTNKAYTKRIKTTKNGEMKVRPNNRCHYNSGERNASKMKKKGLLNMSLPSKIKNMMMPHSN